MSPRDELLTVREAAAFLRLSASALNKARIRGDGPRFVRVLRCVRYRLSDLTSYVNEQTRCNTSQDAA